MKKKLTGIGLTRGERIFRVINLTILVLFSLSALYPFVYFLACSFNDGNDLMRGGIYLWPRVFTLDNYKMAFRNEGIVDAFGVSVFRTVVGTILSLIVTSMAGYAFTYKNMPGKTFLTFFLYFPTLVGGGIIPFFILMRSLHLLNKIWIYILPSLFGFFNCVLMRTYFNSIPSSLKEAAAVDGCSEARIFAKIMLPLSMPMIATLALFIGVGHWNDWFAGQFYITDQRLRPAATLLQQILTEVDVMSIAEKGPDENMVVGLNNIVKKQTVTAESLRMTFVVIITLPIVCVYPFLQKYFIKGVMIGAVKG